MCTNWIQNRPWYNVIIVIISCGVEFEWFYVTERKDRYELIQEIDAHNKEHDHCSGSISIGDDRHLPNISTSKSLKFLCNTINFIGSCL